MLLFSFYFTKLISLAVIIFCHFSSYIAIAFRDVAKFGKYDISQKVYWNLLLGRKILHVAKCSKDWENFKAKSRKNYGKYRQCSQTMNDEIFLTVGSSRYLFYSFTFFSESTLHSTLSYTNKRKRARVDYKILVQPNDSQYFAGKALSCG